jgi:hypothetical protein
MMSRSLQYFINSFNSMGKFCENDSDSINNFKLIIPPPYFDSFNLIQDIKIS